MLSAAVTWRCLWLDTAGRMQVIAESGTSAGGETRPFYDFLEGCLRMKAEMVIFEAARAICAMPDVTSRELTPAITVLQLFLSSSKPVLRFAAVSSPPRLLPPAAACCRLRRAAGRRAPCCR